MKRVVLTGSESTGKSDLARSLSELLQVPWVPEFARLYLDAKGAALGTEDVEPIARGVLSMHREYLQSNAPMTIFDTDLLSTWIYARHYYGNIPLWVESAVVEHRADLYLLCDIDLQWQSDHQRDRGGKREELQQLFLEALDHGGYTYEVISGSGRERLERAIVSISRHFRTT